MKQDILRKKNGMNTPVFVNNSPSSELEYKCNSAYVYQLSLYTKYRKQPKK